MEEPSGMAIAFLYLGAYVIKLRKCRRFGPTVVNSTDYFANSGCFEIDRSGKTLRVAQ